MLVTIDFDSTLSRKDVQDYAISLIKKGVDVWVLTSRYDELHKHNYPNNPTNNDLYEVIDRIGIPRTKVRFTNMREKAEYLYGTRVLWHLDDDYIEINAINRLTDVKGISVLSSKFKRKCDAVLGFISTEANN